ncbi:hypothetical protein GCM10017784_32640 [Deinococcus indicus]|uniref:type ISP restriction/modification enzyme n=1 Tax=Deinococcus indicus TaxID=223556 RepID=UPI00174B4DBE|nr:type ISP restriction/modification enzyme [Deinococcus indicus]GHG36003.1 hypothetical protein GCM10017784_32640 [Deinococcus indicus]
MATSTPKTAFMEYVKDMRKARGKGTPENTYLPILKALLDGLLPEYHVITHPSKDEQGLPDFGLREKDGAENIALCEAEALETPLAKNAHGLKQARDYAKQAPTLLTNFYEFIVLDGDTELGRYTIPHAELTGNANAATLAATHLEPLTALLDVWASARGSLTRPQKIAGLLAYYARQALTNIESLDDDALAPLRRAMEDALGTSFTLPEPQPKNDGRKSSLEKYQRDRTKWLKKQAELSHFFRSSLVQALFYGLFAGWVTAARAGKGQQIDRENIADDLHIPVITLLLDEVNTKAKLTKLDLRAPVDRAIDLLRRVDAEPFLEKFQNGEAVTYFYEPFLEAFDKQLKKDLGIWYTPNEIIRYQIQHVHTLLQTQLKIPQGLLDPNVTILDPATGTGGYLLELARFMQDELKKQGKNRIGAQIKRAFQTRIYGFELLPAPFAIAHLQMALMLTEMGAPLGKTKDGQDERVNVLLTNSLNGWTPRTTKPDTLYNELAHEQELTDSVKHKQKIMVMIGNPPYARFADMPDNPEEQTLIAPYKQCLRESWGVKKQLLDDLYIRFIRLAEWRIAEHGQAGIVSFVTNRSYLTGISHPVMREHLLNRFDHIYIDDLHGNQRAHRAGDGSVFTTDTNGGIRVGVAVGTFVKLPQSPDGLAQVHYREYIGTGEAKRAKLIANSKRPPAKVLVLLKPKSGFLLAGSKAERRGNLKTHLRRISHEYAPAFQPKRDHRYILRPLKGNDIYWKWPNITEIFPVSFSGINTNRDEVVVHFESQSISDQMIDYYDQSISNDALKEKYPSILEPAARYDPAETRSRLHKESKFDFSKITHYAYRPLDYRYLYWEQAGKLLNEKRPDYYAQQDGKTPTLICTQQEERGAVFDRISYTAQAADLHLLRPDADVLPLRLRFKEFAADVDHRYLPNMADFYDDLARIGILKVSAPKADSPCEPLPKPAPVLARYGAVRGEDGKPNALAWALAEEVFYHTLAVLSAPAYRKEHAEYLAEDWPRVPMPTTREALQASAALGRQVAALLDPQAQPDLSGAVGRLVRAGTDEEAGEADLVIGQKPKYVEAREVFVLSDTLELASVPKRVWEFTLGGYPVLKNWVEYRRGRTLSLEDADWLEGVVRRVQGLLELGPQLDGIYARAKAE